MRPKSKRNIAFKFNEIYFKPRGIPLNELKTIIITKEEMETLRLRYIEKLDQIEACKKMGISQSQYQRDLSNVLKKITKALINAHAINVTDLT